MMASDLVRLLVPDVDQENDRPKKISVDLCCIDFMGEPPFTEWFIGPLVGLVAHRAAKLSRGLVRQRSRAVPVTFGRAYAHEFRCANVHLKVRFQHVPYFSLKHHCRLDKLIFDNK